MALCMTSPISGKQTKVLIDEQRYAPHHKQQQKYSFDKTFLKTLP